MWTVQRRPFPITFGRSNGSLLRATQCSLPADALILNKALLSNSSTRSTMACFLPMPLPERQQTAVQQITTITASCAITALEAGCNPMRTMLKCCLQRTPRSTASI